ncbi:MAG: GNAT family N-acetyltransferase [Actinomycetota bacterium]
MADGVTLRAWGRDDAPALVAAWHDPAIIAGSAPPEDRSLAAAERWIAGVEVRERRLLAIDRVIDVAGECVGEVGLSDIDQRRGAALIGWWVGAGHRGHGYAAIGVEQMVLDLAPSIGVHAVLAEIGVDNPASVRVAERAGFTRLREGDTAQPHVYVHR